MSTLALGTATSTIGAKPGSSGVADTTAAMTFDVICHVIASEATSAHGGQPRALLRAGQAPLDGEAITDASEGHIQLVRRLFFGGLPADHLAAVTESLEAVYENLIENGSLPAPAKSDASGPAERDSPTRGPRRPA